MTEGRVAVIGAGPAGLMAAEAATQAGARVVVYDRMRLPGRKFLLAGRGGLNLTHSEPLPHFLARYSEGAAGLRPHLEAFPPEQLRAWADDLGAETYVGSSGRVFPRAMKASPLLRAWLSRLSAKGVQFGPGARFCGIDAAGVHIAHDGAKQTLSMPVVLALGGASWPELGADGAWMDALRSAGVVTTPLVASNVGVEITWPDAVKALAGDPLKPVVLSIGEQRFRGELMLTAYGLEGGAVYAASAAIRRALRNGPVTITLDLKPDVDIVTVRQRLRDQSPKRSLSSILQSRLGLSRAAARLVISSRRSTQKDDLAAMIKALPLTVIALAPIARAISSAGGVAWSALSDDLSLRGFPRTFLAGEMLDWDAPTGGYLLQACFSTGHAAGLAAARASMR